jgi:hypothetical protein
VVNEKNWDKDFNWFDKDHYECFEMVAGSREALLSAFHELILTEYSNKKFGTVLQNIRQEHNTWLADVRRFKTTKLCKKHCLMPPAYVRNDEMMV